MHAAFLGASKGCGWNALQIFLQDPTNTAILLLRKPLEVKEKLGENVNRVEMIQGNGTVLEDVKKLFEGGAPVMTLRGPVVDQPTICTDATITLLKVLGELDYTPRVVAVSSMGIGENHSVMPLLMRILYPLVLSKPHQDKESLEYLLSRSAKHITTPTNLPPLLTAGKVQEIKADFLPEVTIVRPAFFTGGDAPARPETELQVDEKACVYTVRRSEVGRLIVECMKGGWVNKMPVIGYKR
ncbi:hypothetical protein TREMEDRAFT_31795 [Tremella mesenterica DSM 1558]|uniref:uncharacterized protein n=1 Tax=Tremella mesenterica (strain ATCC 24925 / CBS 8224 / DSM 1558 / NBRC 9311 / NRRL Y-6157 / RJB 2259-6 / UBC 559-6) TaxID=578456 RepID=UPI0003F48BE9|nr:uncharacterized protein TREMEDRAFT_31795 [Tremella mesenterica DSM 1558]EIW68588.1 hypothetical protein TREMEDRAFT_31795 [Tremella mesenterica DSM 1558]